MKRRYARVALWLLLCSFVVVACGDPASGPVPVTWGRDTCSHCQMALGDQRHAAQIRSAARVEKFDDGGCALAWQIQHPDVEVREFWMADEDDGRWIDARTAHFRTGRRTPMDFGLGAISRAEADSIDFEAALRRVKERLDGRAGGGAR
mgnify:CR=1 FL=1